MHKKLLREMIVQNRITSSYSFDKITNENKGFRLNANTSSVGFIYRHIGELMNIFGYFFGFHTNIQNTTMGQQDTGQGSDIETSKLYIDKGYTMLESLIEETKEEDWLMTVNTPFFGTVSRIRLFSHVLFHNSHHAGQITMALSKGQLFPSNAKLKKE